MLLYPPLLLVRKGRRAELFGATQEGQGRVGITDHDRACRSHDPGFLGTDGLTVKSEPSLVVKAYARDDGHVRVHDIDGVEATAHAHFQDDQIS